MPQIGSYWVFREVKLIHVRRRVRANLSRTLGLTMKLSKSGGVTRESGLKKKKSGSTTTLLFTKKSTRLKSLFKLNYSISTILLSDLDRYIIKAFNKSKKEIVPLFLQDKFIVELIDLMTFTGMLERILLWLC
jgi:hypothetical protein